MFEYSVILSAFLLCFFLFDIGFKEEPMFYSLSFKINPKITITILGVLLLLNTIGLLDKDRLSEDTLGINTEILGWISLVMLILLAILISIQKSIRSRNIFTLPNILFFRYLILLTALGIQISSAFFYLFSEKHLKYHEDHIDHTTGTGISTVGHQYVILAHLAVFLLIDKYCPKNVYIYYVLSVVTAFFGIMSIYWNVRIDIESQSIISSVLMIIVAVLMVYEKYSLESEPELNSLA